MLTFRCGCGQLLTTPDERAGRSVACPRCRAALTAPIPEPILLDEAQDEEIIETIPVFDELEVVEEPAPTSADLPPLPECPDEEHSVANGLEWFGEAPAPQAPEAHAHQTPLLPETPESEDDLVEAVGVFDKLEEVETEDVGYGVHEAHAASLSSAVTGPIAEYPLDVRSISALAYGADHATALVADRHELTMLDLKTRRAWTAPRPPHHAPIPCLSLSADCRWALSGDADGNLLLWDVPDCRPLRWLEGHRGEIITADFSSDGVHAASGGVGGLVRLWDCRNGASRPLNEAQLGDVVGCVRFSHDGRLLVAVGERGGTRIWRIADGRIAGRLEPGSPHLRSTAFSRHGAFLLAASSKKPTVCRWDLSTGRRENVPLAAAARKSRAERAWITPNGNGWLVLSYDYVTPHRERTDTPGQARLLGFLFGPSAYFRLQSEYNLAISTGLPSVQIFHLERWDAASGLAVSRIPVSVRRPTKVACSPDGGRAIVGFHGGVMVFGL